MIHGLKIRRHSVWMFALLLGMNGLLPASSAPSRGEPPWKDLFDGKTLEGWRTLGGTATYRVEEGVIVGRTEEGSPDTFLCTDETFSDFELVFEVKVDSRLNSGVQVRSNSFRDYKNGRVHGYQVEVEEGSAGYIYDAARRGWLSAERTDESKAAAFKADTWNSFRVLCLGTSLKTWVNGVAVADVVDEMTSSGFIGLQVDGIGKGTGPFEVRWRNLRLRDLRETPEVFASGAEIVKVATGFTFTEGPAVGPDGKIYFTDIPNEKIHAYDPSSGETEVFREQTGRANGLMFDSQGALIACEGGHRQVTRMVDGALEVLASRFDDKRLNSPNDLAIKSDNEIYFTDPRYGDRTDMEMDVEGVYFLGPSGLTRVADHLKRPNGLVLSLDLSHLYVADNAAKSIWRFSVGEAGALVDGQPWVSLDPEARGGGDGMTLDEKGNVYCAGQGRIWAFTPEGRKIAALEMPESPTNCVFGGTEGKTLYVTARTSLYAVEMVVRGR